MVDAQSVTDDLSGPQRIEHAPVCLVLPSRPRLEIDMPNLESVQLIQHPLQAKSPTPLRWFVRLADADDKDVLEAAISGDGFNDLLAAVGALVTPMEFPLASK